MGDSVVARAEINIAGRRSVSPAVRQGNMSNNEPDISVIKDEVLWLLIACFVMQRMDSDPGFKLETRWQIGDWLFARNTVFESIVMRACRLDDDGSGIWSFREAQKRFNSIIKDQKRIQSIIGLIKQYRKDINSIKIYVRNNGLAHIPINAQEKIKEFSPTPMLQSACSILDALMGERVNFTYSCGAYEKVDLRVHFNI